MLGRILGTALIAGFVGGLVVFAVQSVWVIPLIQRAEVYENAGEGAAAPKEAHGHGAAEQQAESAKSADSAESEEWEPEEGAERLAYTALANVLSGVGFALLLVGAIALSGREVDWRRGLLWGLAGFAAFGVAPALGVPPDPPGVDAGALAPRQLWWLGTAAATAAGLALMVFGGPWFAKAAGVVVLVLPHAIGAPHVDVHGGQVPADLIDAFIVASLVTTGLFWLVLGGLSGFLYRKFA